MRDVRIRHPAAARAGTAYLAALLVMVLASPSRAGDGEPGPSAGLVRVPPPSGHGPRLGSATARDGAAVSSSTSGWWLGSAGAAAVLAACGVVCLGARKHWPQGTTSSLRVVGRTSLSPRHSIVLVRAGRRTLMIGLGPQAAPTLLGELPAADPSPPPNESVHRRPGLDIRLGDDE